MVAERAAVRGGRVRRTGDLGPLGGHRLVLHPWRGDRAGGQPRGRAWRARGARPGDGQPRTRACAGRTHRRAARGAAGAVRGGGARMKTLQSAGAGVGPPELAPWFHNLHLPDGRQTAPDHPLGDFPAWKWRELTPHLPDDLSGKRALDIGCNAGFYSFELARRGADVLAIDLDERYLRQAGWARGELGLDERVELRRMSVY